jgi:hypothetical protein
VVPAVPARAVTDDRMPRSARYLDGPKAGQLPSRLRLIRGDLENVAVLLRGPGGGAGQAEPGLDVAGAPGPARSATRSSPGSTARSPRGAGRAEGETGSGCHRGSPRADTPRAPGLPSRCRRAPAQRLFRTGGRLIRHARYFILQLAESQLTRRLFAQIIRRIERLAWHPT